MTDYLTQYADEHGYTLNVRERVEGRHRYISTAELLDGPEHVIMSADSDALHSERPEVIIPIAHAQALKRLEVSARAFIANVAKKPRKTARKVVEDENDG